jgi:hypothetical protein
MDFERERFHHAFLWGLVQETGTIKVENVRYVPKFGAPLNVGGRRLGGYGTAAAPLPFFSSAKYSSLSVRPNESCHQLARAPGRGCSSHLRTAHTCAQLTPAHSSHLRTAHTCAKARSLLWPYSGTFFSAAEKITASVKATCRPCSFVDQFCYIDRQSPLVQARVHCAA